jgi:hypothetical protein
MGGACSSDGEGRDVYRVWCGNFKERDHWGDANLDGRIILRCIFKIGCGGMDWIELAQEKYRWRALVNVVMNFSVP